MYNIVTQVMWVYFVINYKSLCALQVTIDRQSRENSAIVRFIVITRIGTSVLDFFFRVTTTLIILVVVVCAYPKAIIILLIYRHTGIL
jgi:hypothetical protein